MPALPAKLRNPLIIVMFYGMCYVLFVGCAVVILLAKNIGKCSQSTQSGNRVLILQIGIGEVCVAK